MSQMFSKAAPAPIPPPTMPDPMSPAALEAQRKAIADANLAGRQSTILTTPSSRRASPPPTLAATYAGTKTGG